MDTLSFYRQHYDPVFRSRSSFEAWTIWLGTNRILIIIKILSVHHMTSVVVPDIPDIPPACGSIFSVAHAVYFRLKSTHVKALEILMPNIRLFWQNHSM